MRRFTLLLVTALSLHSAAAQDPNKQRETALDDLLSERGTAEDFAATITAARKNSISEQAILEGMFLYHVDREEDDAVAALLPAFLKQGEDFKLTDSAIFSVKEDWLAVVEYVRAIAALHKGDRAEFKSHITEAFWLSPRQAAAFAPHIERLRLNDAMSLVKIDFTTRLASLMSADEVTLASLMQGKKTLLLHFWAPTSQEAEQSLPDFISTATTLENKGFSIISLLTDHSPENVIAANKLLLPLGPKLPGTWLIDNKQTPLHRTLRLQTYPLIVLVAQDGSVLFNGDPSDDQFWRALQKIDPEIVRPSIPADEK